MSSIPHNHLQMRKCSIRWMLHLLTAEMHQNRLECAQETLHQWNEAEDAFLDRLITGDEIWIHYYNPLTQAEANEWRHTDSPPARRPRTVTLAGKVMLTVFWDAQGMLLADFLPHHKIVNSTYYAMTVGRLRGEIKRKGRGRGIPLLHDNSPVHRAAVAQVVLHNCGFVEVKQPPYPVTFSYIPT